jgi:tetratricopeptide (TPR) repeat protein
MTRFYRLMTCVVLVLLLPTAALVAQDEASAPMSYPNSVLNDSFTHIPQTWNNCGPATLTMALTHFGYSADQQRAADWLKPNSEDKNVSPWQMVDFVNTQVPELPVYALKRYGGTLDTLRTLLNNDFPVIIEAGYDPPRAAQGWMGHYLLVIGYDDARQIITTHDSYDGPYMEYTYEHIEEYWQDFNYAYIVLFEDAREAELLDLLGDDADEMQNLINTFEQAREEAVANPDDPFPWFNMGAVMTRLDRYEDAVVAFDQATKTGDGLPWRTAWYRFEMYEAYNAVGDYNATLDLANRILNDGGGHYVEETFYYAGIAREAIGETDRAVTNYEAVLAFNPNFEPARERLEALRNR